MRFNPRLVVYDLDGTLIDSASIVSSILNGFRRGLGKVELCEKAFYPWLSLGGMELVKNALDVDNTLSADYLIKFRKMYLELATDKDSVYEGVFDCLDHLKNSHYHLALCTNKPRNLTEKVLFDTGLAKYFDCVNAGGDLPQKKPHLSNLVYCQDYFSLQRDEVVFIGDSTIDQELARNANVPFIFFESGYDDGVSIDGISARISNHIDFINLIE